MDTEDELREQKRKTRELKKNLKELVAASRTFLDGIDRVMRGPFTVERGRQVARLTNTLNYATDIADHFGLGNPLRKMKKKDGDRA